MAFLLLLFPFFCQSQIKTNGFDKVIKVNYRSIDFTNVELKAMTNVWISYFKSLLLHYGSKNDTVSLKYWNSDEKSLYGQPNLIFSIYPGLYLFHTDVLNIEPIGDNYFRILNCTTDSDSSGIAQTKAIFYVLIKKIDGNYKLFNYFYHEKESLKTMTTRSVQYYYPRYYPLSKVKVKRFIEFKDSLTTLFDEPLQNKIIYLTDTNTSCLMNRLGFIFQPILPNSKDGIFEYDNSMLLSSRSENHRHELVHYFIHLKFTDPLHTFNEGLATYFGGSSGHDLKWHVKNLYKYFKNEMRSDTSKIMSLSFMYKQTDPDYITGAIIMKYAIDNYGFQKALKLLSYPAKQYKPEDVIEKELGIPKAKLNSFLLYCMIKYPDLRPYKIEESH